MPVAARQRQLPSRINAISDFINANYITRPAFRLIRSYPSASATQWRNNDWYRRELPTCHSIFFLSFPFPSPFCLSLSLSLSCSNTQIRKRPENPLWTFPTGKSFYLRRKARKEVGTVSRQPPLFFFAWDFNSAISLILLLGDADLLTAYCAREVRRVNSVWHDALRRNDMLNSVALSRYVTSDNYLKIQNSLYPFERRNQGSGCFAKSTRLQLWISRRNTRFIDPGNYISIV